MLNTVWLYMPVGGWQSEEVAREIIFATMLLKCSTYNFNSHLKWNVEFIHNNLLFRISNGATVYSVFGWCIQDFMSRVRHYDNENQQLQSTKITFVSAFISDSILLFFFFINNLFFLFLVDFRSLLHISFRSSTRWPI